MLEDAIKTFDKLKKYVFMVDRGTNNKPLIIKFDNGNFYHLLGLHKINLNMFFPDYIKTMSRKYEYIKKRKKQFNGIIENQIKGKDTLILRIKYFKNILDILKKNSDITLYDLKNVPKNSLYNGDYGLLKIYENLYCLLALKVDKENDNHSICAPQSWMVNKRAIQLVELKKPLYHKKIIQISNEQYEENKCTIA